MSRQDRRIARGREADAEAERIISAAIARVRSDPGPCPCECNRGEFCGGCGHAGCGGRRRSRA